MSSRTLARHEFIRQLWDFDLSTRALSDSPELRAARITRAQVVACDSDRDGKIDSVYELNRLFDLFDRSDRDGNSQTITVTNDAGAATASGALLVAAERVARSQPAARTSPYSDLGLAQAFAAEPSAPLRRGLRGQQVLAIQHALTRVRLMDTRIDGSFGDGTARAVEAFQREAGLPVTGEVDAATLRALDVQSAVQSSPTIAELRAALDDFSALPVIAFAGETRPRDWNDPRVQQAYAQFIGAYWPTVREVGIECDCKTLCLFMMMQFRSKVEQDTGVRLPMPSSSDGRRSIPERDWRQFSAGSARGLFSRTDTLDEVRPGYDAVARAERLDPTQSMIMGLNLRYEGINADMVARTAGRVGVDRNVQTRDRTLPEVDLDVLTPGDMIFLNHNQGGAHTPAGRRDEQFDHAVLVVGVDRDATGRVTRLHLVCGSFDDMADADVATAPRGIGSINQYMEELEVDLGADGRIVDWRRLWTSEPQGLVAPRYSPQNTLIELQPGGTVMVARWQSRR